MPIYDFVCEKCSITEERMTKISEASEQKCIKCGGPMTKAVSSPGMVIPDQAKAAGFKTRK